MRHTNDTNFIRGAGSWGLKALPLAILLAGMAPLQAMAAGEEVCNTNIFVKGIDGPKAPDGTTSLPFFVGDDLILKASIGADLIRDNARPGAPDSEDPYIEFTGIGYGLDCGGGSTEASCYPVGYPDYPASNRGHDIEFIGVTDSNCKTTDEVTATRWPTPEAENIVSVPALNGPVLLRWHPETGQGDSCTVDMKFRINALHESTNWVVQALGVPYYDDPGTNEDDMIGRCSNGLQATGYGKTVFQVNTCDISVDKQVSLDGKVWSEAVAAVNGQDVFYRVVVTNMSTTPLVGDVVVNDPLLGVNNVSVDAGGLNPGETLAIDGGFIQNFNYQASCSAEETLVNTAGVEAWCRGSDGSEFEVSATMSDTASMTCSLAPPAIELVKTAAPTTYDAVQQTIAYSFAVTNTGNVALGNVYVSDPLLGQNSVSCPKDELAVSESMICSADYSITQADMDATVVNNTATAYGTSSSGTQVSDQDTASVSTTPVYSLFLDKSADPMFFSGPGESISYSYVLTNQGKQTLYPPYSVADDKTSVDCPAEPASLAPAGSVTCMATYLTTAADVTNGSVTNVATGSAMNAPSGGSKVDSNQDQETVVYQAPSIQLVKKADPLVYSSVQQPITYTFSVTNSGDVALDNVYVADPLLQSQQPPVSVSCPKSELAVNESMICSAGYSITQADMDAKVVNNTATAYGKGPDGTEVSDQSSASISTDPVFELSLVKTASPTFYEAVGDEISYEYELTNTGNQTLYAPYDVVDDKIVDPNDVQCPNLPASLPPLASVTCTAIYEITVDDVNDLSVTNKATGYAQDADGKAVPSNEDTATVEYRGIVLSADALCVNDTPWVEYSFDVFGIPDSEASDVSYTWVNVTDTPGTEIPVEGPTPFSEKSGYLLWPGAGYTGDAPTSPPTGPTDSNWPVGDQWPGWTQNPDGSWTETDVPETPELVLRITINPAAEEVVTYPPATPFCTAAPKPRLEVVKSIDNVMYNDDGTLNVTYSAKVTNSGGQKATYNLEDTLLVDESLVPLEIVDDVEYVVDANSEDDNAGTLGVLELADFPGPFTLVSKETLDYGLYESFRFTLQFALDGALTSVEGANCLIDEEAGNTGLTNRVEVFIGDNREDFDEVCDPFRLDPAIEIVKEISLDGVNFEDVEAGPAAIDSGAIYRLTVRNKGNIALDQVTVTDPFLDGYFGGLDDPEYDYPYTFGPLAAEGEDGDEHVITSSEWVILDASGKRLCVNDGDAPLNTAMAEGAWGDPQGATVKNSDTARLLCEGEPMIKLVKRVGVPIGEGLWDMRDANEVDDYPLVVAIFDEDTQTWTSSMPVRYEFEVSNNGTVDLTDVVVSDPQLFGGLQILVGDLTVGQSKTIEQGYVDANYPDGIDLTDPNVCASGFGVMDNTASASGSSVRGDSNVAMDQANVRCVGRPSITIEKVVSKDGVTYDESVLAENGSDAFWKIIVTNDGDIGLKNVKVTDIGEGHNLDPLVPLFNLASGETKTFVYQQTGNEVNPVEVSELFEAGFCTTPFQYVNPYVNTATVMGDADADWTNESVSASDTASYLCQEQFNICTDGGGKPAGLTLLYNGTYDRDTAQEPFLNNGFYVVPLDATGPIPVSPVTVKLYDKQDPTPKDTITGVVVGTKMQILGKWRPDGGIPPNIVVEIIDPSDDTVLQTIGFHGSCSAPLLIGDELGGVTIWDFVPRTKQ